MPKHENAKIVVFGRRPLHSSNSTEIGLFDNSWCDDSGEIYDGGRDDLHNLIDYSADSTVLNDQAISTNCKVIIVCREANQSEGNYEAVFTKVSMWNNTLKKPVPIIRMSQEEAKSVVRSSSMVSLELPKETIKAAIKAATPVQAPKPDQRTLSGFVAQCCTLPKMPASFGIVDALSSTATMVSLKLNARSDGMSRSFASYTKLATGDIELVSPKTNLKADASIAATSTVKEASFSIVQGFKDFVSWARSKMPSTGSDQDRGIELNKMQ